MKLGTLVVKSTKGNYAKREFIFDCDAIRKAIAENDEQAVEGISQMIQACLQRSGPIWEPLFKNEYASPTDWLLAVLKPTVKPNDVDKGETAKWGALWQAPAEKEAAFFAKLGLAPATDEASLAVSFARKRIAKEQAEKAAAAAEQAKRHADLMALLGTEETPKVEGKAEK